MYTHKEPKRANSELSIKINSIMWEIKLPDFKRDKVFIDAPEMAGCTGGKDRMPAKPKIKIIDRSGEWRENMGRYKAVVSYDDFSRIDACLGFSFWRKSRQCWRLNRQSV